MTGSKRVSGRRLAARLSEARKLSWESGRVM
jgi:hypothetical protein